METSNQEMQELIDLYDQLTEDQRDLVLWALKRLTKDPMTALTVVKVEANTTPVREVVIAIGNY